MIYIKAYYLISSYLQKLGYNQLVAIQKALDGVSDSQWVRSYLNSSINLGVKIVSLSNKQLFSAIFLGWCIFQSVNAKHVLPVFSGYYGASGLINDPNIPVADHYDYKFVNNCGYEHFHFFPYKTSDPGIRPVSILKDTLPRPDCIWGNIAYETYAIATPQDFPGTNKDWDYISDIHSGKFVYYIWRRDCVKGTVFVDYTQAVSWPIFQCPEGSRFATADKDDGVLVDPADGSYGGCATKPTFGCLADVVGRDMGSSNGFLGHVGIISSIPSWNTPSASENVIEVLNAKLIIQENTATNFKVASKYWGAR